MTAEYLCDAQRNLFQVLLLPSENNTMEKLGSVTALSATKEGKLLRLRYARNCGCRHLPIREFAFRSYNATAKDNVKSALQAYHSADSFREVWELIFRNTYNGMTGPIRFWCIESSSIIL